MACLDASDAQDVGRYAQQPALHALGPWCRSAAIARMLRDPLACENCKIFTVHTPAVSAHVERRHIFRPSADPTYRYPHAYIAFPVSNPGRPRVAPPPSDSGGQLRRKGPSAVEMFFVADKYPGSEIQATAMSRSAMARETHRHGHTHGVVSHASNCSWLARRVRGRRDNTQRDCARPCSCRAVSSRRVDLLS